jgi:hypothetical protein
MKEKKMRNNKIHIFVTMAMVILLTVPAGARVQTYFTTIKKSGMDQVLIDVMKKAEIRAQAGRKADIDASVFSFTTQALADEILRMAATYPELLKVRIILDIGQLAQCCSHMGPYIYYISLANYDQACDMVCSDDSCHSTCKTGLQEKYGGKRLANIEVRYYFYDAWVWNKQTKTPEYSHSMAEVMHHKAVIVNRQILATGSYNWSETASKTNYENIQVFSGTREKRIVSDFLAEFDAIWNNTEKCLDTTTAQKERDKIWKRLTEENGGN